MSPDAGAQGRFAEDAGAEGRFAEDAGAEGRFAEDAGAEGRFADVTAALVPGSADAVDPARAGALASGLARLFSGVWLVGEVARGGAGPGTPVPDAAGPAGPLRDLVSALAAARSPLVLVVAVDRPRLAPDPVLALLAAPEADAVVARAAPGEPPACAVYRREAVLARAAARLAAGESGLEGLLAGLVCRELAGDDLAAVAPGGALAREAEPGPESDPSAAVAPDAKRAPEAAAVPRARAGW